MHVSIDGPAQPFFEAGRAFYMQRRGQLDLACTHCHDHYAGQRLRGDVISQGQGHGFPIYRHTWQTLGSTHRMCAWCNISVRAESSPLGADAYVNLELVVACRLKRRPDSAEVARVTLLPPDVSRSTAAKELLHVLYALDVFERKGYKGPLLSERSRDQR